MPLRDDIIDVLHRYRRHQIIGADDASDEIAAIIERMDDGPLTTKAVRSYLGAEIRGRLAPQEFVAYGPMDDTA